MRIFSVSLHTPFVTCLLLLSLVSISGTLQSQNDNSSDFNSEVESLRIGYITKQLALTTQEAQQFWPVYNEYQDKLKELRKGLNQFRKDSRQDFRTMSDEDLEELVDLMIDSKQQEMELFSEYYAKYREVLPIRKVALLYKAEADFNSHLVKEIRNRIKQAMERRQQNRRFNRRP